MSTWNFIETVHRPETLDSAAELVQREGAVLLAGGSYLLAERPDGVRELVNLLPLLEGGVEEKKGELRVTAGITLQRLEDELRGGAYRVLAEAARESSSSRNLRSQRTLGGEIAQKRVDSDLRVALEAFDPVLELAGVSEAQPLSKWNGDGIITAICMPVSHLKTLRTQRFALLEHGPAFLLAAACESEEGFRVAVGGRASEIGCWTLPSGGNGSGDLIEKAVQLLHVDHTGTHEYKAQLLATALRRMEVIQ